MSRPGRWIGERGLRSAIVVAALIVGLVLVSTETNHLSGAAFDGAQSDDGDTRRLSVVAENGEAAEPSSPPVHTWFQAKYVELGGSGGILGAALDDMQCQSSSCWQLFQNGVLTSDGTQIVKLSTAYVRIWLDNGGPDGALGLVAGPESCYGTYCVTPFSHGVARWVPGAPVEVIPVHA